MRTRRTLNKTLLRKLALKLRRLRHEEHYNQRVILDRTSCGTAACVAGWTLVLAGKVKPRRDDMLDASSLELAGKVLGLPLTRGSAGHYHWLFATYPAGGILASPSSPRWPKEFADRWRDAENGISTERPSRIAADLLDAVADGKVKP